MHPGFSGIPCFLCTHVNPDGQSHPQREASNQHLLGRGWNKKNFCAHLHPAQPGGQRVTHSEGSMTSLSTVYALDTYTIQSQACR